MPHPFIFLCPVCNAEESIYKLKCRVCGNAVAIRGNKVIAGEKEFTFPELLARMKQRLSVKSLSTIKPELFKKTEAVLTNPLRLSGWAILKQGGKQQHFDGYREIFSRSIELPEKRGKGRLLIGAKNFVFITSTKILDFQIGNLTCVTTDGSEFQFRIRGQPFYQIRFLQESPLKYEILFRKLLSEYYGRHKIPEYQPQIRFQPPQPPSEIIKIAPSQPPSENLPDRLFKNILLWFLRNILLIWVRVTIKGAEYLPGASPFFLIANHGSIFDPFILLAFLDRRIAFLTKSTSFGNPLARFVLKIGRAIPTTRYQTDPMAVRHICEALNLGIPVGIFPEGERCWDGKMQNFKMSVIRVLLALRMPVVMVSIEKSFSFMPRWASFPKKQNITITVKPPLSLWQGDYSVEEIRNFIQKNFEKKFT
jgi:1-acyl-sn-glycerol-3-phosphate acyltransferase